MFNVREARKNFQGLIEYVLGAGIDLNEFINKVLDEGEN